MSQGSGIIWMDPVTVCAGSLVQSAEGAAAPHERSCRERGGVQGWEAPTGAEVDARSSRPGCHSGDLVACPNLLTITADITVPVEAAAPSMSIQGFAVAHLLSSTQRRCCWRGSLLWEEKSDQWRTWRGVKMILSRFQQPNFLLDPIPTWTLWLTQSNLAWRKPF